MLMLASILMGFAMVAACLGFVVLCLRAIDQEGR